MLRRAFKVENWRKANIASFEQSRPFILGFGFEDLRDSLRKIRPCRFIHLRVKTVVGQVKHVAQEDVKLWFDRADGDVFSIFTLIRVVKMSPAVKPVDAALITPPSGIILAPDHGGDESRSFSHCAVDHLPDAGAACVEQR